MTNLMEIKDAVLARHAPGFTKVKSRATGAQKAGKKYERQALNFLSEACPGFVPLPWIMYRIKDESLWRWCQPDGLSIDFRKGHIRVIECKIRHTANAFIKLNNIYLPVLRHLFPGNLWSLSGVEVTRAFDCAVKVPWGVKLYDTVLDVPPTKLGAVVWKPTISH